MKYLGRHFVNMSNIVFQIQFFFFFFDNCDNMTLVKPLLGPVLEYALPGQLWNNIPQGKENDCKKKKKKHDSIGHEKSVALLKWHSNFKLVKGLWRDILPSECSNRPCYLGRANMRAINWSSVHLGPIGCPNFNTHLNSQTLSQWHSSAGSYII